MKDQYSHLTYIQSHDELTLYNLIPNVVWIFDLDRHGWWWGNPAALKFWGLETVEDLIAKDLSGDTQGARDRMVQTFELAARNGLSVDPWTTYPNGKPKTLHMMHRAALIGPDKHRAIIAYINENVDLGAEPENLLLVEAMRYTTVLVTSFTLEGETVVENPAATAAYKHIDPHRLSETASMFSSRFANPVEGEACRKKALEEKGGRWEYSMQTQAGIKRHTLDIRMTRHPLTGEGLLLVVEYDTTRLHDALGAAHDAQEKMRKMAHYDALTGLPSLHLMTENASLLISQVARSKQRLSVMFIDLDGFKAVNDNHGHDAGDQVLKEVASRLSKTLRQSDQVSRIGGDEFVVLQVSTKSNEMVAEVVRRIIDELSVPFDVAGSTVKIGASIGIAFYPEDGSDLESLLKAADGAMYNVKKAGKNNLKFA